MNNLLKGCLAVMVAVVGISALRSPPPFTDPATPRELRHWPGQFRVFNAVQEAATIPTPGNSTTLLTQTSSGTILGFWMTYADDNIKKCYLDYYYDGASTPKYHVQLGTLFQDGNVPGSTFLAQTENFASRHLYGGRHRPILFIPAPYGSVIVKLVNPAASGITGTYFSCIWYTPDFTDADLRLYSSEIEVTAPTTKFSRLYSPTLPSKLDFLNLSSGNAGWIVWLSLRGEGFGGTSNDNSWQECDIKIAIDGESTPSYTSSGTEDFFLGSFYMDADVAAGDPPVSLPWMTFPYRGDSGKTSEYCLDMLNLWGGVRFNNGVHFFWDDDGVIDNNDCHVSFCCLYYLHIAAMDPSQK